MIRPIDIIFIICFLCPCFKSQTDYSPQDYVYEDDYGLTDWQNLRFGGAYDEEEEWKVYDGKSSGKVLLSVKLDY